MSTAEAPATVSRYTGPLALLLIATCAPLFGALTFDLSQGASVTRGLWLPVIGIEIALILTAFAGGFRPVPAIGSLPRSVSWPLGTWFAGAVCAAFLADDRPAAVIFLTYSVIHVMTAIALHDRFATSWAPLRRAAFVALAAGIAAFVLLAHIYASLAGAEQGFDWMLFGLGVTNVRHLGFYAVSLAGIGIGLLAASDLRPTEPGKWLVPFLLTAAGLYFVAWTGGRSPFLSVLAITAALMVVMGTGQRLKLFLSVVLLAAAVMPLTFLTAPESKHYGLENIVGRTTGEAEEKSPSIGTRTEMWAQTAQKITEAPLLGYGQNNWRTKVAASNDANAHPHNMIMQVLFDWGIVGALSLAVIALTGLSRLRGWIAAGPSVALPAMGGLAGLGAMSMTDGVLFFAFPQFVIAVCIGVLASIQTSRGDDAAPR